MVRNIRNRNLINIKRLHKHVAHQNTITKFKKLDSKLVNYKFARKSFDTEQYRKSFYRYGFSLGLEALGFAAMFVEGIDSLLFAERMNTEGKIYVFIFLLVYVFLVHELLVKSFKRTFASYCNILLGILSQEGYRYWDSLSKVDKNILLDYVNKKINKMQLKKMFNMSYKDIQVFKENFGFLKDIECLQYPLLLHSTVTAEDSFKSYYALNTAGIEKSKKE